MKDFNIDIDERETLASRKDSWCRKLWLELKNLNERYLDKICSKLQRRFSRQMVQLLNERNVKLSSFDILQDEEVRQGLKTYSNWPTFPQLYVNGELLGGANIVKEMAESGELDSNLPQQATLEGRLRVLINKAPVMLFMKGSSEQPICGFSKQMVQILAETNVEYQTFDILTDEEVRQGLKTFSNWPTYPQLYVKGELIGGLDIVKELKESGELEKVLKEDQS